MRSGASRPARQLGRRIALPLAAVLAASLLAAAAPPATATPGWFGAAGCAAHAPHIRECATGTHQHGLGTQFGFTLYDHVEGFQYYGVLEHEMTNPVTTYRFRCVFEFGEILVCGEQGEFPAPGTPFAHTCRALPHVDPNDPFTEPPPSMTPDSNTFGLWGCYLIKGSPVPVPVP